MGFQQAKLLPTVAVILAMTALSAKADLVACRYQANQTKQLSIDICSSDYAGAEQSSCLQETEDAFREEERKCDELHPQKTAVRKAIQERKSAASVANSKKLVKKKPTRKLK
jgi:hypothetical protein